MLKVMDKCIGHGQENQANIQEAKQGNLNRRKQATLRTKCFSYCSGRLHETLLFPFLISRRRSFQNFFHPTKYLDKSLTELFLIKLFYKKGGKVWKGYKSGEGKKQGTHAHSEH